jgi:type I restriction enzyme S subunit
MAVPNRTYRETNFKQTVIGRIPSDWDTVKLGEVCEVVGGSTPSTRVKEYWNGEIPFVIPTDVTELEDRDLNFLDITKSQISKEGLRNSSARLLPPGSVLLTSRATIGYAVINKLPVATNQGFANLICNRETHNIWILYLMRYMRRKLERLSAGSTFREISRGTIRNLIIPHPRQTEQKKIGHLLSTVDGAIQKTNEIIATIERLKQGLMQELLTRGIGHKEFKYSEELSSDIPKEWKVVRLGDVTNIRYGLGQPPESDENGVPMIRATNIKRGAIVETGLFRVKRSAIPKSRNPFLRAGDVIVVRSGAYTGDIARVTEKWEGAIAGYDLVLSPTKRMINSVYLANYLLGSKVQTYFSQLRVRAAQPHLNSGQVSRVLIPLPSLAEQEKIATILSTVDKKLEIERNEKANLEKIKQALMDLLLTGKIRIKVD